MPILIKIEAYVLKLIFSLSIPAQEQKVFLSNKKLLRITRGNHHLCLIEKMTSDVKVSPEISRVYSLLYLTLTGFFNMKPVFKQTDIILSSLLSIHTEASTYSRVLEFHELYHKSGLSGFY